MPNARLLLVSSLLSTAVVACALILAEEPWFAPAGAAKRENPVAADADTIKAGRNVFARECAVCHGNHGHGDGSRASELEVKPGDLGAQDVADQTDGALFWKITEGRSPMPTFRKTLSEEERWQAVRFIRTFAPPKAPATPQAAALSEVLVSYFAVGDALAADDLPTALSDTLILAAATGKLGNVDGKELAPPRREAWGDLASRLSEGAQDLLHAPSLDSARRDFLELSAQMESALPQFGHAEKEEVAVFHCPKAFDGKGASWLQRGEEPRNPYLGSRMRTCGERGAVLSAVPTKEKKP